MTIFKRKKEKKPVEYSKRTLNTAQVECWIITTIGIIFAATGRDTEIFSYLIPVSWSGYAVGRAFYYNKAKAENAIKLRKAYQEAGLDDEPAQEEFDEAMEEEISAEEL